MKKFRLSTAKGADLVERALLADERAKELRVNSTKSEDRITTLLNKLKIEYEFQRPFFNEWFFIIADFYLPGVKLCIEVDGESHFNEYARRKEKKRSRWLLKQGIKVLRIKNKATESMTACQLKGRIDRACARKLKKK